MQNRTKTYFLSDFHLGASYISDKHGQERRIVRFLDSIKEDAKEIYLLGDILDYWFEYKNVVPRGFVRFFGKIAELTDAGIKVHWFIGNHDIWIFDYLPNELGVDITDGSLIKVIDGKKFYLAHGDGVGNHPKSFKMLRALFRNKFCQKIYSGIHPRWTIPFALNWSHSSRKSDTSTGYGDNEILETFAKNYPSEEKIDYFVFGHRHVAIDKKVSEISRMIILGDWISEFTYAVFDGHDISLKIFSEKDFFDKSSAKSTN